MSKLGLKFLRVFLFIASMSIIILFLTYYYVFHSVSNDLKLKLKTVVGNSISSVNVAKFQKIANEKSNNIPEYSEVLNSMLLYKAKTDVKNLYTFIKKNDSTTLFIVDASPEPAEFLEEYPMDGDMLEAFEGNIVVSNKPLTDKWGTWLSAYAPIKDSSGKVVGIIGIDTDVSTYQNIKNLFYYSLIAASLLFIILSLLIIYRFSKKLQTSIKVIQDNLNLICNGDLTQNIEVHTRDEIETIANLVNNFRIKMNSILVAISNTANNTLNSAVALAHTSNEMAFSSQNVASAIQEIAKNSSSQAHGLFNINSSAKILDSNLDQLYNSINNVDTSINNISEKSRTSSDILSNLSNSINDIGSSFKDVTDKVRRLSFEIEKVNEITHLINTIADQTNLLALNAAIEASRAGESGRGFSVVADEIRKLAEQSKASSEKIAILLRAISSESSSVIITADKVNDQLADNLDIIKKSAVSFNDIIDLIKIVLPQVDSASKLILTVSSEKNSIINNIDLASTFSEEVSASSEEIASSSEELISSIKAIAFTADNLSKIMSEMAALINGFKTSYHR